ncbi:hypothetical protein JW935_25610, partial [candidate division KSB1 bacterium]|nr:hypothetical protein [candidate division KSB1 bacterium]
MKRFFTIVVGSCILLSGWTYAQQKSEYAGAAADNRSESARIDSLQQQIKSLQARLIVLETERQKQQQKAELDALLQAASDLAQKEKKEDNKLTRVFRGGQRQLQALNPNISLTGDFFGSVTSSEEKSVIQSGDFTDGRNTFYL